MALGGVLYGTEALVAADGDAAAAPEVTARGGFVLLLLLVLLIEVMELLLLVLPELDRFFRFGCKK